MIYPLLDAPCVTTYPSNDVTVELQAAAGKDGNGLVRLTQDSVFHQVVTVRRQLELDLGGFTLQMYGEPAPVSVYGQTCTGPAGHFLDGAGNPIGPSRSAGHHPPGVQFNPIQTVGPVQGGVFFHSGRYDANIRCATDSWAGAVFNPTGSSGGHRIIDFEIINNFGGIQTFPDPVHVDAPNMTIQNYRAGLRTAVPTQPTAHGGVPGGLVAGAPKVNASSLVMENVELVGFLECDGILFGSRVSGFTATHCLIGKSVPAGSWGGAVWDRMSMSWPVSAGPVLNFDGGPYTDWTIQGSAFNGAIRNPSNFKGTWGPGNTPSTLA